MVSDVLRGVGQEDADARETKGTQALPRADRKPRGAREIGLILRKHAKSGKGLILTRKSFVTAGELMNLLRALGYSELED